MGLALHPLPGGYGMRTTLPEPRFPKDGRCVVCKKPITTDTRYADPDCFCTSRCARKWFGTSLAVDVEMEEKSVLAQRVQEGKK